jgi:hypothetical protein
MAMPATVWTGVARSEKESALRALDSLLDFAKRSRAVTFRLDGYIGRTVVDVPRYFEDVRPQPIRVEFAEALNELDVKSQAELAHWLNQNVLLRLCAVLESHRLKAVLLGEKNPHVKLVYRLRNEFAHGRGCVKPALMRDFKSLYPDVDVSAAAKEGNFCLSISEVIEPLIRDCQRAVQKLPTNGDALSPDAIRIELRRRLGEKVFQPFVLDIRGGRVVEIRHPEMTLVQKSYVVVGAPAADDPNPVFYDSTEIVPFSQITGLRSLAHLTPVS